QKLSLTRIKSMDTVRGIAVFLMLPSHFVQWYLPQIPEYSWLHFLIISIIAWPLRFCFLTMPAMGVILQKYIGKRRGIDENILKKIILKRGLLLILIQLFCNILGWSLFMIWNSFVISFIGISIIISYFISKYSQRTRIILIIVIIIMTPFLKIHFFPLYFNISSFLGSWSITSFLYNMFLQVDFPIFPLIAYSIFGTIYAERMIKAIETNSQSKFIKQSIIFGTALILAYIILSNFRTILNYPDFFLNLPPRQEIIYAFGSVMVYISIFFWIQDWKRLNIKALIPFKIYGAISLTVFITHYYFFPKLLDLFYNPWQRMGPYSIFELTLILNIFYIIYGIIILRRNKKYSIEWFIRACT
ncbi:MAG: DUF1624 domain-containing protein, partial [Candidatus Helarchaeota archaeon]|nr:DUF1624 domain-containing protein [Candidatus Helarchaeota archaeon]